MAAPANTTPCGQHARRLQSPQQPSALTLPCNGRLCLYNVYLQSNRNLINTSGGSTRTPIDTAPERRHPGAHYAEAASPVAAATDGVPRRTGGGVTMKALFAAAGAAASWTPSIDVSATVAAVTAEIRSGCGYTQRSCLLLQPLRVR